MLSGDLHNIETLLKSFFPIIVMETEEEVRAMELLKRVSQQNGRRLLKWTAADGLLDLDGKGKFSSSPESWTVGDAQQSQPDDSKTSAPMDMLETIKKQTKQSIITLIDFHPYVTDPKVLRALKEVAQESSDSGNHLVMISYNFEAPTEIETLCTTLTLQLPDEAAIKSLVQEEAKAWSAQHQQKVKADRKALDLLVQNLVGLTLSDAKRLVRNAIYSDGAITAHDVQEVMETKYKLADKGGVLSFEHDTHGFGEVGGFKHLKEWLAVRKEPFLEPNPKDEEDRPKGVLLLGVQGCGKSLSAKAIAGLWGVPLIRLDFGALYNKYIGETERHIREALSSAEIMSPCVLWVDEIEKGIQSNSEDSGTSERVLGTLLTWMEENHKPVFIVATANDIENLPPELIRKGRMDEIFFVDLPNVDARKSILEIHLKRRGIETADIDLAQVAEAAEGFSGSELEQVVVSAYYQAHSAKQPVGTEHLLQELKRTKPLSVVMAEKIEALRDWASDRTVPVD